MYPQSTQMCVASAFCAAVSLRPNLCGAGFFGSLLTLTLWFSPLTNSMQTGLGALASAERVNARLSDGQSSSPKKEDV